ncbi:CDGSH iron-sulfur domain-containing protein [Kitasatospora sp. NPDC086009]|uniref:CDGSH iron-sulfur domain-containing protein n=1 Tax=unclassified Kitasatospora TaxID=2633591 RepID=UPI0037C56F5B
MSDLSDLPGAPGLPDLRETRRLTMPVENGPLLVEGPVEAVLPDGTVRVSERPVVALCVCRRSKRYPFCDTSHRRRSVPPAERAQRGRAREEGAAEAG